MNLFNSVTSALFDVLLAPFGHRAFWFDLLFWPVLAGIVALLVYKRVSNQAGITRAKNGIAVHLLEVLLYGDDLLGVLVSTAKALGQNVLYVGHNILPMVVMFVPMTTILVQLVSNYGYAPYQPGDVQTFAVKLDPEKTALKATDVSLEVPAGVSIDAPPVRTPDGEVVWRLRADVPGDHDLKVKVGTEVLDKGFYVGGDYRKLPILRTKSWEAFLYPGEEGLPADSAVYSMTLHYPDRGLPVLPDGEGGILLWFFGFSLVAGFALKDKFGVTL